MQIRPLGFAWEGADPTTDVLSLYVASRGPTTRVCLTMTTLSPTKIARLQVRLRAQTIQRRGARLRSAPLGSLGFGSCAGSPVLFPQLTDLCDPWTAYREASHILALPHRVQTAKTPAAQQQSCGSDPTRPKYRWPTPRPPQPATARHSPSPRPEHRQCRRRRSRHSSRPSASSPSRRSSR